MFRRIAAICFIFFCTAIAWGILGSTIFYRTYQGGDSLSARVASTWGTAQEQEPPSLRYRKQTERVVESEEKGQKVARTVKSTVDVKTGIESSRVSADFNLDYRQKGLLWFSTYTVGFAGDYGFRNPSEKEETFYVTLPFPAKQAVYDNVELSLDGKPLAVTITDAGVSAQGLVTGGKTAVLRAVYHSRGLDRWSYKLGEGVTQAKDFQLKMTTNFGGFDFPDNTLSPTEKKAAGKGWELEWKYQNLVTGFQIALKMPQKLQPGPLAGRISYFAPVSLFFFFFLVFILTTLRDIDLHPMNYFFLACAFFSFHLLLAYLADHISIHWAFVICSAVSIFLVVSYLRLAVSMRFALVEAALAQLIYLVLFSYAFFFEGMTGLIVTIGAIITLFVIMQVTGRIRWSEKFLAQGR
ncbi:MAG: inner membrane CreD family protein [Acidobacteriia bacterium]|nr:inner membrane CreD family protein [Terriglobia bacterium]